MRSPHAIGLECAVPGMGVFQATFFDAARSQATGTLEVETPARFEPRNAGQFAWGSARATVAARSTQEKGRRRETMLLDKRLLFLLRFRDGKQLVAIDDEQGAVGGDDGRVDGA